MNKNEIDALVKVPNFPGNGNYNYQLNKDNCDWVKAILIELNENADEKLPEEYLAETNINIDLNIEKKAHETYQNYLILTGITTANYVTQCVRTLKIMEDSVETEFKAVFIDEIFEKNSELEDQIDLFINQDLYALYFYIKNQADIKEMIHEDIYLNINQYPICDHESELPWNKGDNTTKQ